MKWILVTLLGVVVATSSAQIAGGSAYRGQGSGRDSAEANERAKRATSAEKETTIDASVLMNVRADEYVALFAISEEAPTVQECGVKVEATIRRLTEALRATGVALQDMTTDYVVQTRIYGFEVTGDLARERLTGYELKKNVAVRLRSKRMLDPAIAAAASAGVFDLVKVDYVVRDLDRVRTRLREEAARVIRRKVADYERLFCIRVAANQVVAESSAAYYPTGMYDAYVAAEAEDFGANYYRQRFSVQSARKSRTFFYNALDSKLFDQVVDPVITEPVVQFTLFLKVRVAPMVQKKSRASAKR